MTINLTPWHKPKVPTLQETVEKELLDLRFQLVDKEQSAMREIAGVELLKKRITFLESQSQ